MSIRVMLVDDHRMMIDGLRLILDRASDIAVVGEAHDGREAVEMAGQLLPDVVVMDIGMKQLNGLEATRQIRAADERVGVIGLSAYADRRYVLGMLEAGARGYVLKAAAGEELVKAVRAVSRGQRYIGSELADLVVESYLDRANRDTSALARLGAREREVLQLLAEGSTSRQIAVAMNISVRTVETHRRNLMLKLGVHNLAELTKLAVREGLTQLEQ